MLLAIKTYAAAWETPEKTTMQVKYFWNTITL